MFNLFKKKRFLPLNQYPQSWSILVEKIDQLLLRVNMGYKDAIGHPDYPIKMGIAIPVEEHDEAIMEMKGEIEDVLNDILLKTGNGALVAIITGMEGRRFIEFLSYTKKDIIDFAKVHPDLQDKFKDYEVQMQAEVDMEWEAYKAFANL